MKDSGGGVLSQPNDITGLIRSIRCLLSHPEECISKGKLARNFAVGLDVNSYGNLLDRVYRSAISSA